MKPKLSILIRNPKNEQDAVIRFVNKLYERKLVSVGYPKVYWQDQLFGGNPDAFVEAEVIKV
jgi:hypothetical protein